MPPDRLVLPVVDLKKTVKVEGMDGAILGGSVEKGPANGRGRRDVDGG